MEWTIHNDRQSVTVGINYKIGLCRKQGSKPVLIRLGKEHSHLFWIERGVEYIPNRPLKLVSGDVSWNEEHHCWCYSKRLIPMRFNDYKVVGIVVDGLPP
jgi:hypothetical protein